MGVYKCYCVVNFFLKLIGNDLNLIYFLNNNFEGARKICKENLKVQ